MTTTTKLIVCIPIYRDWDSVAVLIQQLDRDLSLLIPKLEIRVLLIDDGGEGTGTPLFETAFSSITDIDILRLRRNLGHQRAIAIGLSYIQANRHTDAVLVMDGDGEDTANGVVELIRAFASHDGQKLIFAKRRRRTERFLFKFFYHLYKLLHWFLTGRRIEVGNFSILPMKHIECLVAVPELWNHYAASVIKLNLTRELVPIDRGHRIAGESKMNFIAFVVHGLSAISVYAEEVGVRMMMFCGFLIMLLLMGLVGGVSITIFTGMVLPGWAVSTFGLLFVVILQLLVISLIIVVITLKSRSTSDFIPMRDYQYFVRTEDKVPIETALNRVMSS